MILERINERRHVIVDDRMLDWIAKRIPGVDASAWRGLARAVGVAIDGEIVAGMALGGWERGNIEVSFAADSPRWATRETIAKLMHWPFVQLDCHRVTTRIHVNNHRAIKLNEGIGFKREGLIREGWGPGEDCVVLGLLRSEAPEWMLPRRDVARTLELA